jgi:hypothetical protein
MLDEHEVSKAPLGHKVGERVSPPSTTGDSNMATWTHPNGDTITTEGTTYTVTQNGISRTVDVEKWTANAEQWMKNDIKDGYYEGFVLKTEQTVAS